MTLAKMRWTVNGQCDVIIVGAGNAALCAAIAAREQGASVLVLEKAPEYFRGGNTYFTGGIIRCAYNGIEDIKKLIPDMSPEEEASVDVGQYTEDQFYDDLMRVTNGLADPELAQLLVSESFPTLKWLQEHGVRFVLAFGRQAFKREDKYYFWGGLLVEAVGAGKGLSDQQFAVAERLGVEICYATKGVRLLQDQQGRVIGVTVQGPDGFADLHSKAVILACGGFDANAEGKRFVDEGADFRNYTYAKYGREILQQPLGMAVQIFDDKVKHLLRDEYRIDQVTKAETQTIEELADQLGINREGLVQTIKEYNAAVQPGDYNPTVLDGKHTLGITPPKSNWALPIDTPPFLGFAVTCGITFTFGGLRIDTRGQVLDTEGNPMPGLYAAGELVGGLFYYNYPGGSGLASGAVLGKLAGTSAGADIQG